MKPWNAQLAFLLLLCGSSVVNAQSYLPVGPQTNVPVTTVTGGGWTECYRDTYNVHMDATTVLAACPGTKLMLACRGTGNSTLTLLAQGLRSDVTFDTGDNATSLHTANGVGWYFNTAGMGDASQSWGFVRAGDPVSKDNCDTDGAPDANQRLCWHQNNIGGFRCGATQGLNSSVDFERIVYVPAEKQAAPAPAMSFPLLCLAGLALTTTGWLSIRRSTPV